MCISHLRKSSLRILLCSTTSRIKTLIRVIIFALKITPKIPLAAADTLSDVVKSLVVIPILRENQVDVL
jgi:hypothetical protein